MSSPLSHSEAAGAATSADASSGEQPLAYRAVRGGLWVMLSSYWMVGTGFAANIVLTRLLAPEVFGTFALAMFFAQLLRLQPKLGLGYAFVQQKAWTGEVLGTYVGLDVLGIGASVLLTLLAAPVLLWTGQPEVVVVVCLALGVAVACESLASMSMLLLEREMLFRQTSMLQSMLFPLAYLPAIALAWHSGSVWSLVLHYGLYYGLLCVGVVWIISVRLPHIRQVRWRFDRNLARHLLRFGVTMGIGVLAAGLLVQLDNFFIGSFVGLTALGLYDRAYRTAQWSATLLNSLLMRVALIAYARLQDDRVRLQKTAGMVLWVIAMLAFPLALVVLVAAPDVIHLLYGATWLPAAVFLRFLVVYSVVRPLWEHASTLFVAIGRPGLTSSFMVAQVLVLAVTGIPLTLAWGALGTCFAVGLAFLTGLLLVQRSMQQEVAVNMLWQLALPITISIITVVGYLALSRLTGLNSLDLLPRLLLKSMYALGMFYGLTLLLQPRTTYERVMYVWRLVRQR